MLHLQKLCNKNTGGGEIQCNSGGQEPKGRWGRKGEGEDGFHSHPGIASQNGAALARTPGAKCFSLRVGRWQTAGKGGPRVRTKG